MSISAKIADFREEINNWKEHATVEEKIIIFLNCWVIILMIVSTVFSVYILIAMEYDNLDKMQCSTHRIMQVFTSFTFFEVLVYFTYIFQRHCDFSIKTHDIWVNALIALIQIIFAISIYASDCFSNNSDDSKIVASTMKYIVIFTICKSISIIVGFISLFFFVRLTSDRHHSEPVVSDDNIVYIFSRSNLISQNEISKKPAFSNCFRAFATIAIVMWRFGILAIYFQNIAFRNTEYYFCVASISSFCCHFYNLLSNSNRLNFSARNQYYINVMQFLFNCVNFVMIIVQLANFDKIVTDTSSKSVAISFEISFLITELYVNFLHVFCAILIVIENVNTKTHNITWVTNITSFNKYWMISSIVFELISLTLLIVTIIVLGYYMENDNSSSCLNTEAFLSFYFTIKFFAFVIGSRIYYFLQFNNEIKIYFEISYIVLIWIELINVIVLINSACSGSRDVINVFIYANYICTIIRFLFASFYTNDDDSIVYRFVRISTKSTDPIEPEESNQIFNVSTTLFSNFTGGKFLIVLITYVFCVFVFWCCCAGVLSNSDMNVYGAINSKILKNNVSNSIYSVVNKNIVLLYSNDGKILNVYDEIDPLCKRKDYDGNMIECRQIYPFGIRDWFVANYVIIFFNFFLQLFFLFPLFCFFKPEQVQFSAIIVYMVVNGVLCIGNIMSIMIVSYSSPSGSMFKFLQSPVKQILFIHVYLQSIISFTVFLSFVIIIQLCFFQKQ